MSSGPVEPADLVDLKFLPSWLKESEGPSYDHYQGEEAESAGRPERGRGPQPNRGPSRDRDSRPGPDRRPPRRDGKMGRSGPRPQREHGDRGPQHRAPHRQPNDKPVHDLSSHVSVRFLPHPPALESVLSQIRSNPIAYSVFALARLFLEKPERYDVRLSAKPDTTLYQLGENGAISPDRDFLESNAFRFGQTDFYKTEIVQNEPIKGNFTTVARCRASGTILGPTNHHSYQAKLRGLYEQRFSRRMSFQDFQRQIEIVNNPEVVEQWKEEARNVTTYTSLREEPPLNFNTAAEAERHFRQHYLPELVQPVIDPVVGGVTSRQMADRGLRRLIEDAWSLETRSPSQMMQELSNRIREAGLHIFRHRRGMLFVTAVRVRPFAHEQGASAQVQAILNAIATNPGLHRKDLADKVLANIPAEEVEARKLALASDLHWLISEGNVLEFNDGSLDLPRTKPKPETSAPSPAAISEGQPESVTVPAASTPLSESQPDESIVEPPPETGRPVVAAVRAASVIDAGDTPATTAGSAELPEPRASSQGEEENSSAG